MKTQPIWTEACRDAVRVVAGFHNSADVRSRAGEILAGARIGQTLTPMNVEFIGAMRSRFDGRGDADSVAAERGFELAWAAAYAAAKGA